MKAIKTKAFVLKHHSFGTSHKLMILFSIDLGKIKSIVYGFEKNPHKANSFQILNHLELDLNKSSKSEFYKINDFYLIQNLPIYNLTLEKIQARYFISEYISSFLKEEDPHPEIYQYLSELLFLYVHDARFFEIYLISFRFNILLTLGFIPHLNQCYLCYAFFEKDSWIFVHLKNFYSYCFSCIEKIEKKDLLLVEKISFNFIYAIQKLIYSKDKENLKIEINKTKRNLNLLTKILDETEKTIHL